MLSASYRERMTGNYWLLDAPTDERALTLKFEARAPDLSELVRTRTWLLSGTIDAERFATASAVDGTVSYALWDERRVPYRFAFRGDDGRRYELLGQKEWTPLAPLDSFSLLPATLLDERGEELARATLRFDIRADIGDWIRSLRLHWR